MARKTEPAYVTEKNPFSERLREIMKVTDTKQKTLADAIGKQPQTVSLYLNGQSFPDVLTLRKICLHFDVSADWLLGLTDIESSDVETKAICERLGIDESTFEDLDEQLSDYAGSSSYRVPIYLEKYIPQIDKQKYYVYARNMFVSEAASIAQDLADYALNLNACVGALKKAESCGDDASSMIEPIIDAESALRNMDCCQMSALRDIVSVFEAFAENPYSNIRREDVEKTYNELYTFMRDLICHKAGDTVGEHPETNE